MQNKKIVLAVALFILVVVGMFTFTYLKRAELTNVTPEENTTPDSTKETTAYDYITRIDAKHFFIDGKHTLVGEVTLPTPCDLLEWDARVAESMPEQVTVAFSVVNNAEVCTQVITNQRFKVEYSASENASVRATLQGRDVELNLVPAASGENPDDYEVFIKG